MFSLLVVFIALATASAVQASAETSQICNSAARVASQRTGVPVSVLRAITLTETGRNSGRGFRPWPWTVNMEGRGVWFDTEAEARSYVNQNFRRGARSFDVGCFQLNYKWHGQAFASIKEMFDPTANATYAANYLRELFVEKGNWADAAAAYHSRTPKFADKYRKRFQTLHARLLAEGPAPATPFDPNITLAAAPVDAGPLVKHVNTYPLLQRGSTSRASLGSLFPDISARSVRPLIGGN